MKTTAVAALVAALALPAAAQTATPRSSVATGHRAAQAPAAEGKTPRERARLAKAQNKDARCATGKQKKATAT